MNLPTASHIVAQAAPPPQVVLASTSPYRRELLERLRIPFQTCVPQVEETPLPNETPEHMAIRLARLKAQSVSKNYTGALVIGSDQVACFAGQSINKPGNHDRALAQLRQFQGQEVSFHTALCVLHTDNQQLEEKLVTGRVLFRQRPEHELDAYLKLEQPYDCAGSAKFEGLGITLIERIESDDPTALMGLPLIALVTILQRFSYPIFQAKSCSPVLCI